MTNEISKEQEERARRQFEESLENVDYDDVSYAAHKGDSKLRKLDKNPPGALLQLWKDVKSMVRLLRAYIGNEYREVPWSIIAAITGAVVYFVMPIDVIPDFIPGVGYLDDAVVLKLALDVAREDLRKFEIWAESRVA